MAFIHIPDQSRLQEKITTLNSFNLICNELRSKLIEHLRPFIGKKIIKTTPYRSLTAKVKDILDSVLNEMVVNNYDVRARIDCQYSYSLYVEVKLFHSGEYITHDLWIGDLKDNILQDKYDEDKIVNLETDYDYHDVYENFIRLKQLTEEEDKLRRQLSPFLR